ncbi:hypothetical protein BV57P1_00020 [Phocaeicola phage BV57P1]|nr:hypothetical protein BV57P1_00020 [Phocaeicola phage BV57P1]
MRTLLIDEKGVMYLASLSDIRDLRAGIRRPSTVLPSLERVEMPSVFTEEWERREYLDFLCNTDRNGRKHNRAKAWTHGHTVNAYRYLHYLFGFRTDVAAMVGGHKYMIPLADAIEYTLGFISRTGLMRRMRMRDPSLHNIDHLGVTNFLIVV